MATVSKDTIAQFWLQSLPCSSLSLPFDRLSVTNSTIVQHLREFRSTNDRERQIFEVIHRSLCDMPSHRISASMHQTLSTRQVKNHRWNTRARFTVHIDTIEDNDDDNVSMKTNVEGRRIDENIHHVRLSSIELEFNAIEHKNVS
jgi:hypothetical protein